jgi:hypothetical protein
MAGVAHIDKVCERWHLLSKFIEDVVAEIGYRPSPRHIFDRIGEGDYAPRNVHWVTELKPRWVCHVDSVIELDGVSMTATEWAKRLGITYPALYSRLKRWPLDEALTCPPCTVTERVRRYRDDPAELVKLGIDPAELAKVGVVDPPRPHWSDSLPLRLPGQRPVNAALATTRP